MVVVFCESPCFSSNVVLIAQIQICDCNHQLCCTHAVLTANHVVTRHLWMQLCVAVQETRTADCLLLLGVCMNAVLYAQKNSIINTKQREKEMNWCWNFTTSGTGMREGKHWCPMLGSCLLYRTAQQQNAQVIPLWTDSAKRVNNRMASQSDCLQTRFLFY